MVKHEAERQRGPSVQMGAGLSRQGPLVAFDFDGTLTTKDSFIAFLKWRVGSYAYYMDLIRLAPAALRYVFNRDKSKIKSAAIRVFLRGVPRKMLEDEAAEFAAVAAPMLLRPDALKVWRRHRADGARMVIVTASPETIVAPFARGLGADLLIASQLAFDDQDRVGNGLFGRNCRGEEKVYQLRSAFGQDVGLAAAYGDTDGDTEMLELAEQKFMRLFVGDPGKRK